MTTETRTKSTHGMHEENLNLKFRVFRTFVIQITSHQHLISMLK